MSRAFVREDVEVAERSQQRRSASGLPPGTLNLMTADGAAHLREQWQEQRLLHPNDDATARLEEVLASATIVMPITAQNTIVFGSTVRLRSDKGEQAVYRIVGVDEVDMDPTYVSWLSYLGKTLLGAGKLGQRISLAPTQKSVWTIVGIE